MYHTTGFRKDEITDLCALVHARGASSGGDGYPPILSLFKSVVVTLTYLRRNHVQQELAEYYGVSQSTISRAITAITPELAQVMRPFTPTADELPRNEQLIVDGTLVSCWSWDNHPELYSGKHHTTGLNLRSSAIWPDGCAGSPTPSRAAATTAPHCAGRAFWTESIPRTGSATKVTSGST
jgi:hypothetical protein